MLEVRVHFEKIISRDNFNEGVTGSSYVTYNEVLNFKFYGTLDLKKQLANWIGLHFDVKKEHFLTYVRNEIENNRFDYSQNEDGESNFIELSEENPDGYLCDYIFHIDVYEIKKISYEF